MKVGIIGDGSHSKRIQKILKKKKIDFFIYKPGKINRSLIFRLIGPDMEKYKKITG